MGNPTTQPLPSHEMFLPVGDDKQWRSWPVRAHKRITTSSDWRSHHPCGLADREDSESLVRSPSLEGESNSEGHSPEEDVSPPNPTSIRLVQWTLTGSALIYSRFVVYVLTSSYVIIYNTTLYSNIIHIYVK